MVWSILGTAAITDEEKITPPVIKCVSQFSFICRVHYCNGSSISSWGNLNSRNVMNLKARNICYSFFLVFYSAYARLLPDHFQYTNHVLCDYQHYFLIIVPLIMGRSNNVITTKIATGILVADSAKTCTPFT